MERRLLTAIVAAGLVLMLLAFHWGLPNVESWNGDDIAPDKPLRVLHDWWRGHHKYPYLHWWLNLPLYRPGSRWSRCGARSTSAVCRGCGPPASASPGAT